jgi:putative ABC transport system permease protein
MKLAFRELRRRPGQFVVAVVILTLISMLIMLFGGILDALIGNSTAAVRAQRADAVVFSDTAQSSFLRSRIDADLRAKVESTAGVTDVGGIGVVQVGARVPGKGPRELLPVALFGYELAPQGLPDAPPAAGQVLADRSLGDLGVEEGMEILLGPARSPVTVVGFVDDTNYLGQGSLWGSPATWRTVLQANRPDEILPDTTFQSLVVRGDGGAGLAAAIDAATGGATVSLTVDDAANALPGVSEQQATFSQIINTIVLVALIVVALFFALLVVERAALYGVLKAIGASSLSLFTTVVVQAVVVALLASLIAGSLATVMALSIPAGAFPFTFSVGRFLSSAVILVVAAVIGCAFSLRRVLKIDPASAIGGAQ